MSIWQCCVFDLPLCRSEVFYHLNMGTEFIEIGLTDTAVTVFLIKSIFHLQNLLIHLLI